MAYQRFGYASDIYLYHDVGGYICCMSCKILPKRKDGWPMSYHFFSYEDVLAHLKDHMSWGHEVHKETVEWVTEDMNRLNSKRRKSIWKAKEFAKPDCQSEIE
jgi:hypothetical protein